MLSSLISSKTRIKLLLRFFVNPAREGYLRSLATEFGESTNSVRLELNRLSEAGLLKSEAKGNKRIFKANDGHPMFQQIHSMVLNHLGVDQLIGHVVSRLGNVSKVYLEGDLAKGIDSDIIDIIVVGDIDKSYLVQVCEKAETILNKKVRYLVYGTEEWEVLGVSEGRLLVYGD